MSESVKTTCPYCGVGCGVLARREADGEVRIEGDPTHPANYGRLCSKGANLGDTLSLEGRALRPRLNGQDVDWDTALDHVAQGFAKIIETHGPRAVAFYVSGQLLTEDYYVANKLMKGFIGAANIDTNSRLCMSSAVAAYKRAFGSDTVPCNYEDLERTNLIVLTGSNTAWCHPVIYQRIKKAKEDNPHLKIVVIDPRRTVTCEIADMHLALKSGTDALLFNGLLVHLNARSEHNQLFIDTGTEGLEEALSAAYATAGEPGEVAERCGLDEEVLRRFYDLFARTEKVVTVFSQGVNQFSMGTDKANAIINCHLFTGRIGRPGMGPFSLTGQPNAMGGREVGGLANQLAAHMELDNPAHRDIVQGFWGSPRIADKPGLKAVDMFKAIGRGEIKAVWIMATNPAVSLPDNNAVREALKACELVVLSDCTARTDTGEYAHVLLPAATWGERDGAVTNSERRISRQRAFLDAPGEARPDWWIICEVARRMGFAEGFNYQGPHEIFDEHARLSGHENAGQRDFDISKLAGLDKTHYENLQPVQWPVTPERIQGTPRLFGNGRFFTPTGRARFIPIVPRPPVNTTSEAYPLILNTGRVRDHWHTLTRTGKSAKLSGHIAEAFAEVHPEDAKRYAVEAHDLVRITSRWGEAVVRVRITEAAARGSVFMPMHWNRQFAGRALADALVNPVVDPISGEPEFKHTPVAIEAYRPAWYGFLLSRRRFDMSGEDYWNLSRGSELWRYEIAGEAAPGDWANHARALLCATDQGVAWVEYYDAARSHYRAARLVKDRLESCIFIGPKAELPPRDWLMALFDKTRLDDREKAHLLSGRPGDEGEDAGPTVCACFNVGKNTLLEAIKTRGLASVEAIGAAMQAGTNCGSCKPELKALLERASS